MKKFGLIAIATIFCLAFSCEEENNNSQTNPEDMNVKDISNSDCKDFEIKCTRNEDCVNYYTVDEEYLRFERINAAFNCCFDSVIIDVKPGAGNTITITETENAGLCDCICLYDIESTIGPLDYGEYDILIAEQYNDTMAFSLDFKDDTGGQYCETRSG